PPGPFLSDGRASGARSTKDKRTPRRSVRVRLTRTAKRAARGGPFASTSSVLDVANRKDAAAELIDADDDEVATVHRCRTPVAKAAGPEIRDVIIALLLEAARQLRARQQVVEADTHVDAGRLPAALPTIHVAVAIERGAMLVGRDLRRVVVV